MTDSKTSYPRISPVISKYEFVMSPFLLFFDTKRLRTYSGNIIDHTIGGTWYVTLIHTPPTPSDDESVNPMYCGFPSTSLYMIVGCWEMSLSRVSQYSSMSVR